MSITKAHALVCAIIAIPAVASAQNIDITIENLQPTGGFSFTPFWFSVHNGGFDSYDGGATLGAFPGTEQLAELGMTGPISDAFAASAAGLAGGVQGTLTAPSTTPPVFVPGDSATVSIDVGNASVNRYFSYASMVIPSNDLFVANGSAFAHELFDINGNFNGPITINIFGVDVLDAGTELNDVLGGPAFVAGQVGTDGTVTNDAVFNFFTSASAAGELNAFIGTSNPLYTVSESFTADNLIARITIVPAPGTAALGLVPFAALARRRRAS